MKKYVNKNNYDNATLEPDAIMLYGTNVYVLVVKYYKYNVDEKNMENMRAYNEFLMPFDFTKSKCSNNLDMFQKGEPMSKWENSLVEYQKMKEIEKLEKLIEN